MGLLLAWLVFSVLVGLIAAQRGRSGFGFFFLSLLLSPLLGLIAVVATPNLAQEDARARERESDRSFQRNLAASAVPQPVASFADEVEKLAALRERGVITHDEFAAEKSKLLSRPASPPQVVPQSLGTAVECERVLEARGYCLKRRGNGSFEVYEPLGGMAAIPDLERLILYTSQQLSIPVE